MKQLAIALSLIIAILGLSACSGGGSNEDTETKPSETKASIEPAQKNDTTFHELSLTLPSGWVFNDTSTTDFVKEGKMMHEDLGGAEWTIRDGGAFAFYITYDTFNNLDVGLSSYEGDEVRKAEASAQAFLKALDARFAAKFMSDSYGETVDDKNFTLEEQNSCAVWEYEGKDDQGATYVCAAPYDDHIIAVFVASKEAEFSDAERALISSIAFSGEPDSAIVEKAKSMTGKSTEEVMKDISDYIESITVVTNTDSNNSSNSNGSNSTGRTSNPTTGMQNAYRAANDYLKTMAFSRSGLIKQLKYEGYTSDEAEYAVSELERTGVDWNVMATRAAEQYLKTMSFSKSRLKEQLIHDGFTPSQAQHAVDMVY